MTDFNSSDRDVNRAIRSWLREDRHEDVSRIAGAVLDLAETTPQRRAIWWPARRTTTMNKMLAIGLGAAAVVVALFVGVQLFSSPSGGTGGQSTASPESTASTAAGLPVGSSYELQNDGIPIHVTISAPGWSVNQGSLVANGGEAPDGAYLMLGTWVGVDPMIPSDPCQWESTMPDSPATTLDEIVAALGGQETRNASAPRDVTVDGYAGKSITIEMPAGVSHSASNNPDCDQNKFCTLSFGDGTECHMWYQEATQIDQLWIIQVDDDFYFVPGSYYAETPAAIVEQIGALLGSLTFDE